MQNRNNKNRRNHRRQPRGYEKKTVSIRRVAKVTKGGRRLRFSAMVIVGDKKGKVGIGLGRGSDTRSAVEKGERVAVKAMTPIQLIGDTIPHEIEHKHGSARVLLRPAKQGTGIIAGSSVRVVLELAGIENVYGKLLGSNDPISNAYCTFEALQELRNGRVLRKMRVMRERVQWKKDADAERKTKEIAKRKANRKNYQKDNRKKQKPNKKFVTKPVKKGVKKKPVTKPVKKEVKKKSVTKSVKKEVKK
ncbi:30S ribosomal protein S5 [bacterium]|nr:30S ribosomal protein S5 [bacterium]